MTEPAASFQEELVLTNCAARSSPAESAQHKLLLHQLRDHHRWMLGLSITCLVTAYFLQTGSGGTVAVRWLNISLPPLCGSRTLFNTECPGCGLTRSVIALVSGDLDASMRHHRLGWLLALAIVLQIPYRMLTLRELRHNKIVTRQWPVWVGNGIIIALIVNWILKLLKPL